MRELKEANLSLTSPSSPSTDTTNNSKSLLSSSSIGGRAIDRCSPHLRDPLRAKSLNPQPQNKPRAFINTTKGKKSTEKRSTTHHEQLMMSPASSQRYLLSDSNIWEDFVGREYVVNEPLRFQASEVEELSFVDTWEASKLQSVKFEEEINDASIEKEEESVKVEGPIDQKASTSSSSSSSSSVTTSKIVQQVEGLNVEETWGPSSFQSLKFEETNGTRKIPSTTTTRKKEQQVVVLRVSLHCKGCEGKVRKHISKMEGVTSFSTDLVNKKVTVIGEVTPLGVLNSISKVKNAQLWPSQPLPSS